MAAVALPPHSPPPRTSRVAILAKWIGITALAFPVIVFAIRRTCEFPLLSFLTLPLAGAAVVLGFAARFRISRNPGLRGLEKARVAYNAGAGGLVLFLVLLLFHPPCGDFRVSNDSAAVGSLRTINTAELSYATTYPKVGYSPTLEVLGGAAPCDASSATACLIDQVLASGRKSGYVFTYTPGPPDAKGVITSYKATARPQEFEKTGQRSFYTDQTAVIRSTTENRPPTAQDPPLQ